MEELFKNAIILNFADLSESHANYQKNNIYYFFTATLNAYAHARVNSYHTEL